MNKTDEELDKNRTPKEKAFLAKVRELTNAEKRGYRFFIERRIVASICFIPFEDAGIIRFPDEDKFRDPEVIAQAVEMYRQGSYTARKAAIAEQQAKLRELCGLPEPKSEDDE